MWNEVLIYFQDFLFLNLLFGTFILEDVALLSAIKFASDLKITWIGAFLAIFLGISIGDLFIFYFGVLVTKWPWLKSKKFYQRLAQKMSAITEKKSTQSSLDQLIVLSRFIPGTRVLTYVLAGVSGYSAFRFLILTILSVFAWVLVAFLGGKVIIDYLQNQFIFALILIFIFLQILKKLIKPLFNKWEFKILKHSWRKWTDFEFWPAWFFYIPFYFYYAYLSFKHKSLLTPFYINPEVFNGGILGESKWDFMRHTDSQAFHSLRTVKFDKQVLPETIINFIKTNNYSYPVILKPDIGQRGFGVRIIKSEEDIKNYILQSQKESEAELILQTMSPYKNEAGLFFIRYPDQKNGFIYSITDKAFPFVTGNGKSSLGELIEDDARSRMMLGTYYQRHWDELDLVLDQGQKFYISECGNHCQGAIFYNGLHLKTEALEKVVNEICLKIPHFYFGRLDIRYESQDLLMKGLNFHIVEINGAGAEATHIWDARTKILTAYKDLFHQWSILFSISANLRKDKTLKHKVFILAFLKESFKVYFRKGNMTVSS